MIEGEEGGIGRGSGGGGHCGGGGNLFRLASNDLIFAFFSKTFCKAPKMAYLLKNVRKQKVETDGWPDGQTLL